MTFLTEEKICVYHIPVVWVFFLGLGEEWENVCKFCTVLLQNFIFQLNSNTIFVEKKVVNCWK